MINNKEKIIYMLKNKRIIIKLLREDISLKIKGKELESLSKELRNQQYTLITTTAIDQIQKINRYLLQYVYIGYNKESKIYINLNSEISTPSITEIFPSAIWLEREIYDLFGIYFTSTSEKKI